MPKPYRAVIRVKNNRLWSAILASYPEVKTQADAARALGVNQMMLGKFLNMRAWPYFVSRQAWTPLAKKVSEALGETEAYLFDASLYGRRAKQISIEIDTRDLVATGLLQLPEPPDLVAERRELANRVVSAVERLTPKRRTVVAQNFGIGGTDPKTLEEIAGDTGTTISNTQQLLQRGIRDLRRGYGLRTLLPMWSP